MDTTTAKASWTRRHPRLSAVLWALPYLAFLAFPLVMVPSVESFGMTVVILALTLAVAVADIAIYVVNPTPEWGAHIKKKMWISHGIDCGLEPSSTSELRGPRPGGARRLGSDRHLAAHWQH